MCELTLPPLPILLISFRQLIVETDQQQIRGNDQTTDQSHLYIYIYIYRQLQKLYELMEKKQHTCFSSNKAQALVQDICEGEEPEVLLLLPARHQSQQQSEFCFQTVSSDQIKVEIQANYSKETF